jgi:hypothetical protein
MMRTVRRVAACAVVVAIGASPSALAADGPRYDVPAGFTRCPDATAWNGFYKWASVQHSSCRYAQDFIHAYAHDAADGPMPLHERGFRCRVHYWKNADGDVYASRHRCVRRQVIVRFYGMV